jgi:hypothetical protein
MIRLRQKRSLRERPMVLLGVPAVVGTGIATILARRRAAAAAAGSASAGGTDAATPPVKEKEKAKQDDQAASPNGRAEPEAKAAAAERVDSGAEEWSCQCGQSFRIQGQGRHRVFWLADADAGDPVIGAVCPACERPLPRAR